ncbi:CHAP domain-containing protein [Altererythrobacter aquiaggeris]|uniref:CHAP domain-containing protein n=1 Tax=Aestuarierythrobacter aquiaggeris TaxID=1898396 RepID=UPI00301AF488
MIKTLANISFLGAIAMIPSVAAAEQPADLQDDTNIRQGAELPAYLQCVPYARQVSGIRIFGDAHTWWDQADGRFARGNKPKVGAVMSFRPNRAMELGHVAAVSQIVDQRTVLLRHSNWSPINGRRGQIEDDVRAVDVSADNDWSAVRVWYHPLQALGRTAWPVNGFIYAQNPRQMSVSPVQLAIATPAKAQSSQAFLIAFSGMAKPAGIQRTAAVRQTTRAKPDSRRDPIAEAIARY